ncbi:hypothetical protein [Pseudonocardia alaniniphila]|uniref:Uncharacterized protein n=1 Tax=Pseudonocardia alaniniphila TaxID=75291 RepID=A0ABS9TA58_9PSEU|nr:hypothetical protein [Pseudonocardia alaniniphila]MCH6165308.1 hypothetical protein [Pseudonocardia alaniniphila]
MTDRLLERLVAIADRFNLSGLDLIAAVNFERDAPDEAIAEARSVITEEFGYISDSVMDEIIELMAESDLYND